MRRIILLIVLVLPLLARAEEPQIVLSTLEWPPYAGTQLPHNGYAYQVVTRAFANAGLQPQIRFYPWARALKMAEAGKVDGAFPEYFAPDERPQMLFSDAFPAGAAGLVKLRSNPANLSTLLATDTDAAMAALDGLHLGLVRGYVNHPALDAHPNLKRSYAREDVQNLDKLLAKRVDLIFIDFNVARYLIGQTFAEHSDEFEMLQPALLNPTLHLIMPRHKAQSQAYMTAFNQGLMTLRDSGELKAIMQSHGLQ